MLVKSNNHSHFKRSGNVLYEVLLSGELIPLYRFKQSFIDVEKLNQITIDYTEKYIEMYPELVEKISNKPIPPPQLSFF